jgi:hypothetical protein
VVIAGDPSDEGRGGGEDTGAVPAPQLGPGPLGAVPSFEDCEVVYEQDSLIVRTPPPGVVFVMKLYRADPQDREDMVLLWPMCGFAGPEDAVNAFDAAYPHAPEDEHLVEYVRQIAHDASSA